MPGLREPCPICKGKVRHKRLNDGNPCPNKRTSSPRGEHPENRLERLRTEVASLPDGDFTAHLRHVLTESGAREKKIKDEAIERLQALKEAHTSVQHNAHPADDLLEEEEEEEKPLTAAEVARRLKETRGAPGLPAGVQANPTDGYDGAPGVCGAKYPENILIKCKQPTRGGKHAGMHYNREHKQAWHQTPTEARR